MSRRKIYTIRQQGQHNDMPFDWTMEPLEDRAFVYHMYVSAKRNPDIFHVQFIERTITESDHIIEQDFK
jgi:hypothetical protein